MDREVCCCWIEGRSGRGSEEDFRQRAVNSCAGREPMSTLPGAMIKCFVPYSAPAITLTPYLRNHIFTSKILKENSALRCRFLSLKCGKESGCFKKKYSRSFDLRVGSSTTQFKKLSHRSLQRGDLIWSCMALCAFVSVLTTYRIHFFSLLPLHRTKHFHTNNQGFDGIILCHWNHFKD